MTRDCHGFVDLVFAQQPDEKRQRAPTSKRGLINAYDKDS